MTSDERPRILLLNGPSGCGKDQAAAFLKEQYPFLTEEKFSNPLKWAAQKVFSMTERELEAWKRESEDPRTFQIGLSELVIKPLCGEDWFGRSCAHRILDRCEDGMRCFVVSDCGFQAEVEAFVDTLWPSKIELWRIQRPYHTFEGDSRDWAYLDTKRGSTRVIMNSTTLGQFKDNVLINAESLFGAPKPALAKSNFSR